LRAAKLAKEEGDFKRAITDYKEARKKEKDHHNSLSVVGLIVEHGLIEDEREFLTDVMTTCANNGYYYDATKAAKILGETKKAEEYDKLRELLK